MFSPMIAFAHMPYYYHFRRGRFYRALLSNYGCENCDKAPDPAIRYELEECDKAPTPSHPIPR